jgi:polyhydroxyalkanoate synthase
MTAQRRTSERGKAPGKTGTHSRATLRQGPRPLPLHLGTMLLTCLSSLPALALWRSGSLPWSPDLAPVARSLKPALDAAVAEKNGEADLAAALARVSRQRMARFLDGVLAYRRSPLVRTLADPPVIWRDGAARLLDYGAGAGLPDDAPLLLAVPSLVNRAFILDLTEGCSLMRWLVRQGIRPLMLDWGCPGDVERAFTLTDYVAGPLESAIDVARAEHPGRLMLLGYCMGGLLALAAALRRPNDISGLALLATPWNFHADEAGARRLRLTATMLGPMIDQLGELPVDVLQSLFFGLDPMQAPRKFESMADEPGRTRRMRHFVATEDWLNDGVPLAGPVARECLFGWYGNNTPASGTWRVAGRAVDPARFAGRTLLVVPEHDRIVPPESALALADALPDATLCQPPLGHIGMMVGGRAKQLVWQKLAAWCHDD